MFTQSGSSSSESRLSCKSGFFSTFICDKFSAVFSSVRCVNILSACFLMSIVQLLACLSPTDGPLISACLCYVCRCAHTPPSTSKQLVFCLLHLLYVWCLARTLPCFRFACDIIVLGVISVVLVPFWCCCLCCVGVISLPLLDLSLHYLSGYLSPIDPLLLSYTTIKVVTLNLAAS